MESIESYRLIYVKTSSQARRAAPWASIIVQCPQGFMAFRDGDAYVKWKEGIRRLKAALYAEPVKVRMKGTILITRIGGSQGK